MAADETLRIARSTPQMKLQDYTAQVDFAKMRVYRMKRAQEQLAKAGYAAAVLFDPINIRYASGASRHPILNFHLPMRCLILPAQGLSVIYEFDKLEKETSPLQTVAEVRAPLSTTFFAGGPRNEEFVKAWVNDACDVLKKMVGSEKRIAIDRIDPETVAAFQAKGYTIGNAQKPLELARVIKSDEEIACMSMAITVGEEGMNRMREALRPGMTENELWAHLHHANIAHGGEWIEARLLNSGGNILPWGKGSSDKMIRAGELVAFDTDMIGPFGYAVDVSRTFYCKPGKPTDEQRRLYNHAVEEVAHNIALVRPGLSFKELSEKAWKIPDEFVYHRYSCLAHGIGMCDEYPYITHAFDWKQYGYDGVLEEGMTICIESFIGSEHGIEGVKLEEQVLVTRNGCQKLSTFPYEEELMN
ncbi:M24 family metallopeptidase [Mesorhizobium waimense]|nr:Xaa-Pro peptidase family protein [Mesorhizobium waimense]